MFTPRRFLPSIASLLALEAVDRLGSATAAAAELSLTPSVSIGIECCPLSACKIDPCCVELVRCCVVSI